MGSQQHPWIKQGNAAFKILNTLPAKSIETVKEYLAKKGSIEICPPFVNDTSYQIIFPKNTNKRVMALMI